MARRTRKINREAVKSLCMRLGIEPEVTNAESQEARDELLQCFSERSHILERLAKEEKVTLYELSNNCLLPTAFKECVFRRMIDDCATEDHSRHFVHKTLDELRDTDFSLFRTTRLVGTHTMTMLSILISTYYETDGFRTLLAPAVEHLTATAEIALISRIVVGLRDNPKARRKLMAMFPAP
jgi:hypothetical protein